LSDPATEPTSVPMILPGRRLPAGGTALPRLLQDPHRGDGPADPFVNEGVVAVEAVYDLARAARGGAVAETAEPGADRLLALEADDGTTVFIRADRLREDLARLYSGAVQDGRLDLSVLRDREAASRGLGDWVWSKLSVLALKPDAIIDAAKDKAREWVLETLGEQFADKVGKLAGFSASTLGAQALMWAIESRLPGEPGLYRWGGGTLAAADRLRRDDPRLAEAARTGPLLVFIHGTGSHTVGSFGDLRSSAGAADWAPIAQRYGERVFGFEHRTFSESPIDNALALAEILPAGTRLALVTHSRGGLVGDLLSLGGLDAALIAEYRRPPAAAVEESPEEQALREACAAAEQAKLTRLRDLLAEKDLRIERYVRVASPARGTLLLSDNLEVFLSGLLSLMSRVVGAVAGPAASPVLSAFKRIVLEIADKRLDPHLVPGIEAMLTDAPMGRLLARAPRKQGVAMAVIAGDSEGADLVRRLGLLFTDWMFFDQADNDLVVDTGSMYGGLAQAPGARYLLDQGATVSHFRYFDNRRTREALRDWLTVEAPADLQAFGALAEAGEPAAPAARARRRGGAAPEPDTRPVVVVLPGIMGTHLERRPAGQRIGAGNRIWFDPLHLARGGLGEIRFGSPGIREESLFEMFYGDLVDHLAVTHAVIPFPYDWRLDIRETAERLAAVVREALETHPHQPVRLLAHSMGGLVVRAMIARDTDLWQTVVARPGGRFVMLGTPNNGSHAMVEALLGKSDAVRNLARIDVAHSLQEVLAIVAGFPGGLQLLPRPGFRDAGQTGAEDYLAGATWEGFRPQVRDRWFGDGAVGVPDAALLQTARRLWDELLLVKEAGVRRHRPIAATDRVAYVFGQADRTACGLRLEGGRLKIVGTAEGDGSVSWAAGRLDFLPDERCWHMPVDHGALAGTAEHFPAIVDLLQTGDTARLGRLPVSRGTVAQRTYDAGPVPYPTGEELARSLMSSKPPRRRPTVARQRLAVEVVAMDLRNAHLPVMCGHYVGDPIAGAEDQIDRHLVDGTLRQRQRLGVYAGEVGSAAVVLMPRSDEDLRRGTGKGAVIVGLGDMGQLTVAQLTETVRAGTLRFLLQSLDREYEGAPALADRPAGGAVPEVELASLLIGYNSTTLGSVEDFVDAICLGVCEANRQFADAAGPRLRVGRLVFLEVFLDVAITAAHAVRGIGQRLAADLRRLEVEIAAADRLAEGEGVRQRLYASGAFGYWPRLLVTATESGAGDGSAGSEGDLPTVAARLHYVYLSARARAETVVQQRQPGLAEALVAQAIGHDRYDADLARTLFQLMVPLPFKATARELERLALVVDGYTANLPWEMLQAGDEPMVIRTALVRQLATTRFRQAEHSATSRSACIIVDPSTEGFLEAFGRSEGAALPRLPGASDEGLAVRGVLESQNYQVTFVPPESEATDVLARLFRCPYRILMVAAHGVFRAVARDGSARTGVVLSGGTLLTAAEVGQMEVVPEVAFLNCCHLGKVDAVPLPADANRLAYSLARELIEMGVRCVVVAGWAVNDEAARTFAVTFFEALAGAGATFGDAVHAARRAAYAGHGACNTWGAYQAYGDAGFVLETGRSSGRAAASVVVAPEELVAGLVRLRDDVRHGDLRELEQARRRVRELLRAAPADWGDLPEVQVALGGLYAEIGQPGFDAARAAYLQAIGGDDHAGRVPLRAIEQLANLEALAGRERGGRSGLALVGSAIRRLEGLLAITKGDAASAATDDVPPPAAGAERGSLLGSALKIKAELLAAGRRPAAAVVRALEAARDAYAAAESATDHPGFDPYPSLNRLQLDAVLGEVRDGAAAVERVRLCQLAARRRFQRSYSFWDAVAAADAEVTARLLTGKVAESEEALVRAYEDAVGQVPKSARQRGSMVRQIRVLAGFLRLRGEAKEASALQRVASRLDESGVVAKGDGQAQSPTPAGTGGAKRRGAGRPARAGKRAPGAANKRR